MPFSGEQKPDRTKILLLLIVSGMSWQPKGWP